MRLIDIDAMSHEMYHLAFETDSDMQKWDGGCWIRYKMFEKCRDNAPIIEAEQVRHGKWEYVDYGGFGNWHCTACRKICICNGDFDYCPNCGAKMD